MQGYQDDYAVLGAGTPDAPEVYEPYFYRTFRFLRLRVRTGDAPLEILRLACEETGVKYAEVEQDNASDMEDPLSQMEISARNLKKMGFSM